MILNTPFTRLFAAFSLIAAARESVANGAALRILPLGDSITYGFLEPEGNSYRRDLQCLLSEGGSPVQYIGQLSNGNWPNNATDGFIGQTIDQISASGDPEITGSPKANVVLLHAGTNDMIGDDTVDEAPARLGNLIDKILSNSPATFVLVAQILNDANSTVNDRIQVFNSQLPAIIEARSNAGKPVRLVSMSSVPTTDMIDGTHPNEVGYMKMANIWYPALVQAGEDGLIVAAEGVVTDGGPGSLPAGGGACSTLPY
ncbi:SGNH hydrolase [Mollisia scopiformis]|uniref:SGNH hydrolase n=1 Tax=Mollisia scopiformis TaxID=149040 RepID=A0A194XVT7_MOLSC|nr:SGNH hydrolase [Mollisia scopiformis]KUJ24251.1 SGNH hydrolase [Mollisia scopiformis]